MFRLTRSHVQPIGLDVGYDSIKMMQLEIVGSHLSVVAAAQEPFPEEVKADTQLRMAASADMIRSMLRRHPFRGRNIATTLPREIVHIKNLRLPLIPINELEAAVKFEAKNIFAFDTDQSQIRFLPAGEVRQGVEVRQEAIAIAVQNTDVNNYLDVLHRSGVIVESLDIEPCALFRTIERFIRRREDEQEVYVLVDIGGRGSQVVIGKGRDISFFKPIEIGGKHLHEAVSKKLSISMEEARALRHRLADATELADPSARRDPVRQAVFDATRSVIEELGREISLCLRYYSVTFRGHRPTRLRLVGGEASDPQLIAQLNASLTIPVEAGRPLYSVNTSKMKPAERRGTMSGWALACGLSLKFTKGHFGARDGKPRDPNAPHDEVEAAPADGTSTARAAHAAEVVDLNKAVATVASAAATDETAVNREVQHA